VHVVNERLVSSARVDAGATVLDVATGIGEPALTAARIVGPDGRVIAIDLSPGMLEMAIARANEAGIDNVEFRVLDVECLDLPESSVDAAMSRFGIMLMRDPGACVLAIRERLRPGARFAAAVWGASVPLLRLPKTVIGDEIELPPAEPDAPGPFRLNQPDKLSAVMRGGGLDDVVVERMTVTIRFASGEEYAEFVRDMSSTTRRLLAGASDAVRARVLSRLAEAAEREHGGGGGGVEFDNEVLVASGGRRG